MRSTLDRHLYEEAALNGDIAVVFSETANTSYRRSKHDATKAGRTANRRTHPPPEKRSGLTASQTARVINNRREPSASSRRAQPAG
jgi:hypothetical protein